MTIWQRPGVSEKWPPGWSCRRAATTLFFVAPRDAVAARLTCRKRFRPIYSCSRIKDGLFPGFTQTWRAEFA